MDCDVFIPSSFSQYCCHKKRMWCLSCRMLQIECIMYLQVPQNITLIFFLMNSCTSFHTKCNRISIQRLNCIQFDHSFIRVPTTNFEPKVSCFWNRIPANQFGTAIKHIYLNHNRTLQFFQNHFECSQSNHFKNHPYSPSNIHEFCQWPKLRPFFVVDHFQWQDRRNRGMSWPGKVKFARLDLQKRAT